MTGYMEDERFNVRSMFRAIAECPREVRDLSTSRTSHSPATRLDLPHHRTTLVT